MRESINRGCAWTMVVSSIGMLLIGIAGVFVWELRPNIPVVAIWALILFFGIYVLSFKKPKDKTPK